MNRSTPFEILRFRLLDLDHIFSSLKFTSVINIEIVQTYITIYGKNEMKFTWTLGNILLLRHTYIFKNYNILKITL